MNRKLIATAGAAIIAAVGVATPAMAYEVHIGEAKFIDVTQPQGVYLNSETMSNYRG